MHMGPFPTASGHLLTALARQYPVHDNVLATACVVPLDGLRGCVAHGHGDVFDQVALVEEPLTECPATGTELEPRPADVLHDLLEPAEGLLAVELHIPLQRREHLSALDPVFPEDLHPHPEVLPEDVLDTVHDQEHSWALPRCPHP